MLQNILVKMDNKVFFMFQPLLKYFQASRKIVNAKVMARKFKGLSDGSIEPPESDNSLSPTVDYFNNPNFRTDFNGSCITTDRVFNSNFFF